MDRWTGPSIFIHGMPRVSHVKLCLSESSMCQWVNEKVSEWKRRSKTVIKGAKIYGFYCCSGVKMADRWTAAGGKSACAIHKVPLSWPFSILGWSIAKLWSSWCVREMMNKDLCKSTSQASCWPVPQIKTKISLFARLIKFITFPTLAALL